MKNHDKLCPCLFLIPVLYNDGREIEAEVMSDIRRALDKQFGGVTVLGEVLGVWQEQEEGMVMFKVAVVADRIPELKAVVKAIGKRLGQKAMYFEEGAPVVEIITVEAAAK